VIPPLAVVGLGAVALYLYYRWSGDRGSNSRLEEEEEGGDSELYQEVEDVLLESLGWPYYYGHGSPGSAWEDGATLGVDCSGYAQMALVALGVLSEDAADRSVSSLADDSDPIEVGSQELGDLALYDGHVMVVAGPPGEDGHSPVIGASGGDSDTLGDDENAYVKLFDSALYRSDFITYMRLRS